MRAEFEVLFKVLSHFLKHREGEVQGRMQPARPPPQVGPPPEVENLLRGLLSGELDEGKRRQLCELLSEQPSWLTWLAEQIKHRRKTKGGLGEVSSSP